MTSDRLLVITVLLLLLLVEVSVMTSGRHDNRLVTSANSNRRKWGDFESAQRHRPSRGDL